MGGEEDGIECDPPTSGALWRAGSKDPPPPRLWRAGEGEGKGRPSFARSAMEGKGVEHRGSEP